MPLAMPSRPAAAARSAGESGPSEAASPQRSILAGETATVQLAKVQVPGAQRAADDSIAAAPSAPFRAPGSALHSEQELEELARRLYGRIRMRLRKELLGDRERMGTVVDLR